jgi:hypothetical protein
MIVGLPSMGRGGREREKERKRKKKEGRKEWREGGKKVEKEGRKLEKREEGRKILYLFMLHFPLYILYNVTSFFQRIFIHFMWFFNRDFLSQFEI